MVVKKEPVAGSLIKAGMVKDHQPYDLWAIVLEFDGKGDKVVASVVEVVPQDYQEWTSRGIEPPPAGKIVTVLKSTIEIVVHPRRRMTKGASPQFVLKLNNGRISDIYAIGGEVALMRLVDLAKHYGDGGAREGFHKDVMVTRKGVERLDGDSL